MVNRKVRVVGNKWIIAFNIIYIMRTKVKKRF